MQRVAHFPQSFEKWHWYADIAIDFVSITTKVKNVKWICSRETQSTFFFYGQKVEIIFEVLKCVLDTDVAKKLISANENDR